MHTKAHRQKASAQMDKLKAKAGEAGANIKEAVADARIKAGRAIDDLTGR